MTITDEDRKQLEGSTVLVSISGGKDSTAVALYLREQGIPFSMVHADTGWEHPEVPRYVDRLEEYFGQEIVRVGYPGGMAALIRKKTLFPGRVSRFCTENLKTIPLIEHAKNFTRPIQAVGIRAEESRPRASQLRWSDAGPGSKSRGIRMCRPLLLWTLADVVEIHQRNGLAPNPLYLRGATRVGCWPCIFARKSEILRAAEWTPKRIDEIEAMEAATNGTFFQARNEPGGWPIRSVVEWARAPSGADPKQQTLFAYSEIERMGDEGCSTWGVCEHNNEGWPEGFEV